MPPSSRHEAMRVGFELNYGLNLRASEEDNREVGLPNWVCPGTFAQLKIGDRKVEIVEVLHMPDRQGRPFLYVKVQNVKVQTPEGSDFILADWFLDLWEPCWERPSETTWAKLLRSEF